MVGVWADPVTAHVMMTLRGSAMSVLLARVARVVRSHDANGRRIMLKRSLAVSPALSRARARSDFERPSDAVAGSTARSVSRATRTSAAASIATGPSSGTGRRAPGSTGPQMLKTAERRGRRASRIGADTPYSVGLELAGALGVPALAGLRPAPSIRSSGSVTVVSVKPRQRASSRPRASSAWQPGEERLAGRGGVQRDLAGQPADGQHRRGRDLADVGDAVQAGDREVGGLAGLRRDPLEDRPGPADQAVVARRGRHPDHRQADAGSGWCRVALDQAVRLQGPQQPPGRRPVEVAPGGERRDRLAARRGGGDDLEQPERAVDGLHPRREIRLPGLVQPRGLEGDHALMRGTARAACGQTKCEPRVECGSVPPARCAAASAIAGRAR